MVLVLPEGQQSALPASQSGCQTHQSRPPRCCLHPRCCWKAAALLALRQVPHTAAAAVSQAVALLLWAVQTCQTSETAAVPAAVAPPAAAAAAAERWTEGERQLQQAQKHKTGRVLKQVKESGLMWGLPGKQDQRCTHTATALAAHRQLAGIAACTNIFKHSWEAPAPSPAL